MQFVAESYNEALVTKENRPFRSRLHEISFCNKNNNLIFGRMQ
jgi:hypothetical protein